MAGPKPIADGTQKGVVVFDYKPREFPTLVTESAVEFNSHHSAPGAGFKINPLLAQKAGISKLQAESLERAIEAQALEKLKEVQEKAYQEAFELGLAEGTEKAFEEHKEEFAARLSYLDSILKSFEDLKFRLVAENETQFVSLIFDIAKRLALREVSEHPEAILDVIRKVVEDAQTDERMVIRISQEDYSFIENLKDKSRKDQEVLSKVRLEVDNSVKSGGCLLETNYGSIDASLPQRIEKAWELLRHRTPKIEESDLGLPTSQEEAQAADAVDSWAAEIEGLSEQSETEDQNSSQPKDSDDEGDGSSSGEES